MQRILGFLWFMVPLTILNKSPEDAYIAYLIFGVPLWAVIIYTVYRYMIKRMKEEDGQSKDGELMKNWKVPAIILVLLIVAMTFRWSTVSSQTTTSATIKHRQDNWNSSVYKHYYSKNGEYSEKMVKYPSDIMCFDSKSLTVAWGLMAVISTSWLLVAVSKTKKKERGDDING